jgi:hypothetical protein
MMLRCIFWKKTFSGWCDVRVPDVRENLNILSIMPYNAHAQLVGTSFEPDRYHVSVELRFCDVAGFQFAIVSK